METLLQIPKEDYKKTIVYLFTYHQTLEQVLKTPMSRKKKKDLTKQITELKEFIEKYENTVLKTVED